MNRFLQGLVGLMDIRETVLFPRDAKRLSPWLNFVLDYDKYDALNQGPTSMLDVVQKIKVHYINVSSSWQASC